MDVQGLRHGLQQGKQRFPQRSAQLGGLGVMFAAGAGAQCFQQMYRGRDTHISGQQHGFQFVVKGFVELASCTKETAQTGTELRAAFAEALLQPGEPAWGGGPGFVLFSETKHG